MRVEGKNPPRKKILSPHKPKKEGRAQREGRADHFFLEWREKKKSIKKGKKNDEEWRGGAFGCGRAWGRVRVGGGREERGERRENKEKIINIYIYQQQLQAMLAAVKTPQDFQKILEEGSSSFSQENSYVESDDSTSYLPDNGDDCEGILPSIRRSK